MRKLVGKNVKLRRLELGMTQEDLAVRSGFDQRYISELETGKSNPTIVSLFELAQALSTTPVALISPGVEASPVN